MQSVAAPANTVLWRLCQTALLVRCAAGDLQDDARHPAGPSRGQHLGRGLGVLQDQWQGIWPWSEKAWVRSACVPVISQQCPSAVQTHPAEPAFSCSVAAHRMLQHDACALA